MNAQLLWHVCNMTNAVQRSANIDMVQTASLVRCLHCTLDTMLPLAFLLARCSAATAGYYLVYWPVFGIWIHWQTPVMPAAITHQTLFAGSKDLLI
jgi:hypothetical protein